VAGGQDLDVRLEPLAAYLGALGAKVGALEWRSSAVRLMTAADAGRYARVKVETVLRAVRAGELPIAGYIGRSPSWLAASSPAAPVSSPPRRRCPTKASDAVEAAWRALG